MNYRNWHDASRSTTFRHKRLDEECLRAADYVPGLSTPNVKILQIFSRECFFLILHYIYTHFLFVYIFYFLLMVNNLFEIIFHTFLNYFTIFP